MDVKGLNMATSCAKPPSGGDRLAKTTITCKWGKSRNRGTRRRERKGRKKWKLSRENKNVMYIPELLIAGRVDLGPGNGAYKGGSVCVRTELTTALTEGDRRRT